MANVSLKLALS